MTDPKAEAVMAAIEALEHICRRLQMDIDDGGRPDQWSMEDLVRKAQPALSLLRAEQEREQKPVGWVSSADFERLTADKWAVAEVSAYEQESPGAPLYASPVAAAPQPDLDHLMRWCQSLIAALKRLSFAAQTTGGTAGPDAELQAAIGQAEEAMSMRGCIAAAPQGEQQALSDGDRAILEAVRRELDEGDDNAPGHAHAIPGIWDSDNGLLAGKPCAWCLTWRKFTALLSAAPARSAQAADPAARSASTQAEARDALEEFDERLTQWARAYPVSVFPEVEDWKAVNDTLAAAGLSLTRVSAANMRHVVTTLNAEFDKVRAALDTPAEERP